MGDVLWLCPTSTPQSPRPFFFCQATRVTEDSVDLSSLALLVFLSLFLSYPFLLVYLIMELVAYFYGYSLHP